MSKEIIQFDQAMFESKLDAMVREKVTELLNDSLSILHRIRRSIIIVLSSPSISQATALPRAYLVCLA